MSVGVLGLTISAGVANRAVRSVMNIGMNMILDGVDTAGLLLRSG